MAHFVLTSKAEEPCWSHTTPLEALLCCFTCLECSGVKWRRLLFGGDTLGKWNSGRERTGARPCSGLAMKEPCSTLKKSQIRHHPANPPPPDQRGAQGQIWACARLWGASMGQTCAAKNGAAPRQISDELALKIGYSKYEAAAHLESP